MKHKLKCTRFEGPQIWNELQGTKNVIKLCLCHIKTNLNTVKIISLV